MPIRFACERCDARIRVPEAAEGRTVRCPRCGQMQVARAEVEQAATAPALAGAGAGVAGAVHGNGNGDDRAEQHHDGHNGRSQQQQLDLHAHTQPEVRVVSHVGAVKPIPLGSHSGMAEDNENEAAAAACHVPTSSRDESAQQANVPQVKPQQGHISQPREHSHQTPAATLPHSPRHRGTESVHEHRGADVLHNVAHRLRVLAILAGGAVVGMVFATAMHQQWAWSLVTLFCGSAMTYTIWAVAMLADRMEALVDRDAR